MHDHHIYISAPLSSYFSSQLGRFQNLRRVFGEQFAPFTVKYIYIYIILPGLSRIGDLNRSYHLSLHVILLHCLMLTKLCFFYLFEWTYIYVCIYMYMLSI
ncbi:hypothetical protein ERO13_D07G094566v2, partial [Gossypium hirsutum]